MCTASLSLDQVAHYNAVRIVLIACDSAGLTSPPINQDSISIFWTSASSSGLLARISSKISTIWCFKPFLILAINYYGLSTKYIRVAQRLWCFSTHQACPITTTWELPLKQWLKLTRVMNKKRRRPMMLSIPSLLLLIHTKTDLFYSQITYV